MTIFLTGFMGVGKSTVGRLLAHRLGYRFIDLDERIETLSGQAIPQLFAHGEAHFRKWERDALLSLDLQTPQVVATGGGVPCSAENRAFLKKGSVLYLKASPELLWQRLQIQGIENRPLLKNRAHPFKWIAAELERRSKWYEQADHEVKASGTTEEVVSRLLEVLGQSSHTLLSESGTLFSWQGQHLELHPLKAVYWHEKHTLILTDLHLGKEAHFRKNGIALPRGLDDRNLALMDTLLDIYTPKTLLLLGDLFHSRLNRSWEQWVRWKEGYADLSLQLVKGNHDILPPDFYREAGMEVFDQLFLNPFIFTHEPPTFPDPSAGYILSGHVHPAVRLKGKSRQSLKLPCFYFGEKNGLLPAFGQFTGTSVIEPAPGSEVFVIVEEKVIQVPHHIHRE